MKIAAAPPVLLVCAALLLAACASGGGAAPEPRPAGSATGSVDTARVYGVDEVTVKARLANSSTVARALEQNYSGVQRDAGLEGTVDLQMTVERNGHTSSIVVVRSSDAVFNTAAVNVARAMRFSPAQVNGVPVRVRIDLPITFRPSS
ncbi:MAG TPA: energy transducer TonB [Longimicrobium sp.]|nr:energy transducer TonB [Longimicrobium sp.]